MAKSFFNTGLLGAAGTSGEALDDQFNRVSFLSHFEGSNNGVNNAFDDGSTSNHTITANGNVTQGSFGPFARPDGEWGISYNDGYMRFPDSADWTLGDTFTLEAFIFPTQLLAYNNIMSHGNWYFTVLANGALQVYGMGGDGDSTSGVVALNTWSHVAFSVSSGTGTFYVNGVARGTTSSNDIGDGSGEFYCGKQGVNYWPFYGVQSNYRVVKGTAVYTSNFTVPTTKLTAITNTKLLTGQSNRFVDNSASGHVAERGGTIPSVTAFGPFLTSSVYDPAVNGASAYFDGSGDYLSAPTIISQSSNFTIEGWAYATGTGNQTICGQYAGSATGRMLIESTGGHIKYFQDGVNPSYASSNLETLNQWCHFVLMRTGSNVAFYVNGTRVQNVSAANMYQGNFEVGGEPDISYDHKGYVSNIRCTASAVYSEGTSITVPTAPYSTVTNTNLLLNMKDGQAIDSATQNNLTLDGNTKISNGQAKFGDTSLLFDGTTDYAKTIFNTSFGAGDFTIEYFFRVGSVSTDQNLFQFAGSFLPSDDGGPGLGIRTSRWRLYTGANTSNHHGSAGPSNDTWYHIAVVRNGTTTKLYVDGVETISVSDSYDYSSRKHLLLGGGFDGNYDMNGYIDEFRVSHFARYTSNNFTVPSEPFADKGQDA